MENFIRNLLKSSKEKMKENAGQICILNAPLWYNKGWLTQHEKVQKIQNFDSHISNSYLHWSSGKIGFYGPLEMMRPTSEARRQNHQRPITSNFTWWSMYNTLCLFYCKPILIRRVLCSVLLFYTLLLHGKIFILVCSNYLVVVVDKLESNEFSQ